MAGEEDAMRDLFGSASEGEEDAPGRSAVRGDSPQPSGGGAGPDAGTAGPSKQDQMRDLFGSDEESDDGYRVAGAPDVDDAGSVGPESVAAMHLGWSGRLMRG